MADYDDEECVCARCHADYYLRENSEPSKYCDACAHGAVDELEAQLSQAQVEIHRLNLALAQTDSTYAAATARATSEAKINLDYVTEAEAEIAALRAKLERVNGKRFPVHSGGMTVPWQMLAPHEPQALANHQQTLERLAERGGLGWAEMLCVLEGRSWQKRSVSSDELAKPKVLALVAAFDAAMAKLKETQGAQEGDFSTAQSTAVIQGQEGPA
jgi:uncharacterized small protein (DUF1192 family)